MNKSTSETSYENPALAVALAIKKRERDEKRALEVATDSNLAELMKLDIFRKVVNRWMKACGIDDPINHKNSNDREQALGKREIGLLIKKDLEEASDVLYDLMVDEARDKTKKGDSNNA